MSLTSASSLMKHFSAKKQNSSLQTTLLKCQIIGCWVKGILGVHRPTILPVVLYGYETLSLTLWEEHRLRVFSNSKKCKVSEDWRKLHSEELHDLYCSPNINGVIKTGRMRWVWYVPCMVQNRNVNRVLEGNLKERDPLEDTDIDGRIILKWILQILNRRGCGLGLYG